MAIGQSSVTTASLLRAQAIFYRRQALDMIMKRFMFMKWAESGYDIPSNNGDTIRMYRDVLPGTDTSTKQEGVIGSGLDLSDTSFDVTVGYYSGFTTLSNKVVKTHLRSALRVARQAMSYRAAASADLIVRLVLDAESGQAGTQVSNLPDTNLSRDNIGAATQQMQEADIEPHEKESGYYACVTSPLTEYDLLHSANAGDISDLLRGRDNQRVLQNRADRGKVIEIARAAVYSNNNVAAPSGTTRRTYIFGKGAYGIVNLAGEGPTKVMDPKKQSFRLMVNSNKGGSTLDPTAEIEASVGYRMWFAAAVLDSTDYRYRIFDLPSTLLS